MTTDRGARFRWPAAALLGLLVSVAARGQAAKPSEGATAAVREALGKASAVGAGDRTRDEQLVTLRVVARELVNTRAMGRRAIGDAFASCTAAQQEEFLRLFDELFVRSYLQKLLLFRGPTFRFGQEHMQGDAVIVSTQIVTGDDAYAVAYEMRREESRWRAADVVVEGVSMASNYSDQFASLLRNRSFDELLELMRRKVERFREAQ